MKKYIAGVLVLATFIIGGSTAHASFFGDVWGGLKTVIHGSHQNLGAAASGATNTVIKDGTATQEVTTPDVIVPIKTPATTPTKVSNPATVIVPTDDTPILTPTTKPCVIQSFTATPATIQAGDSSTLAWKLTNCTSFSLSTSTTAFALLPTATTILVTPSATTTYTLVAKSSVNTQSLKTTVTVNPVATPSITVTSPNGGEVYQAGDQIPITWVTHNVLTPHNIAIYIFSCDANDCLDSNGQTVGGFAQYGFQITADDGQETTNFLTPVLSSPVPGEMWGKHFVACASVVDSNNQSIGLNDCSNSTFTRVSPSTINTCTPTSAPSITVLSPNGGEIYKVGDMVNVKWTTCNLSPSQNLLEIRLYNKNSGLTVPNQGTAAIYVKLPTNTGNENIGPIDTFPASIGPAFGLLSSQIFGKNYSIEVAAPNGSGFVTDKSDSEFSINKKPVIIKNPEPTPTGPIDNTTLAPAPTLSKSDITDIQTKLKDQGFLTAKPNGKFGPKTKDAVKKFQEANGLDKTGVVDTATSAALKGGALGGVSTIPIGLPTDPTDGPIYKQCTITSLSAAPAVINAGATSTISWSLYGCKTAKLDGVAIAMPSGSKVTSTLTATKTFTLVAVGGGLNNTATKTITIVVNQPPTITVTSPNGGESYVDGQQITVTWNAANIPTNGTFACELKVYDTNNTLLGIVTLTGAISNSGRQWTLNLPTLSSMRSGWQNLGTAAFGNHFKMSVYANNSVSEIARDDSDNFFTIYNPITVTSPNGGEVLTGGQQATVTWTNTSAVAATNVTAFLQVADATGTGVLNTMYLLRDATGGSATPVVQGHATLMIPTIAQIAARAGLTTTTTGKHFKIGLFTDIGPIAGWVWNDASDGFFTIN
jgi:peptidoglycan hydrolase-like protein with peptidoglycan-binding domain